MYELTLQDLQNKLFDYLSELCSLDEFREWFDVATWGVAAEPDSAIRKAAGEIELRLAEFTNGHLGEADLRHSLAGILPAEFLPVITDFHGPLRIE